MAFTEGDIIQATLQTRLTNQVCLNVFHYRIDNLEGVPTPAQFETAFFANVWTDGIRIPASNLLFVEKVTIANLTNGIDQLEQEHSGGGAVNTSEPLPPQCAVTIRLLRSTLVTRNGYKRIPGIPEGQQNGGILNGAAVSLWASAADVFDTGFSFGTGLNTGDAQLVIVGRFPDGTLDLTKINPVASSIVSNRVGSQNTRKLKAT